MPNLHQEYRLPHGVGDVLAFHDRFWHPREAGEFIDHSPDIVDLPHDGVGTLFEDALVFGDDLAEFTANALGRKLDRRQRVLDFVGDAARNVAPRRCPLRGDELRDVVERDNVAVARLAGLLGADANRQVALMAVARDRDLALHQPLRALARGFHHVVELWQHVRQRMVQRLGLGIADKFLGRTVQNADAAGSVDADDAGTGRRQHRLDESPAAVDQVRGVHQFITLGAQFGRHLVEGLAELREVTFRLVHRHLDMQIAGRNDIGGAHQIADRRHQPVGEIQPDQHRRHQDGERDHRKHQREGDLDAEPAGFDLGIFGHAGLGLLELRDHARIEQPRHIQERIVEGVQPDHRSDVICVGKDRDLRLVLIDIAEEILRRRREVLLDPGLRRFQDVAILVDQHGSRQIPGGGAHRQQFAKRPAVLVKQRPRTGNVVGHPQDVAADQLRMFVGVGPGNDQRILHHLARRTREQPVQATVDGHVGDDRDQYRRKHGDDREQADDLDVQPCRSPATPPRLNHQPDFADDDADQQQDGRRIDQQERIDHLAGWLDRRQAAQHHEGQECRQQRDRDRKRRHPFPQDPPSGFGKRRVERLCRGRFCGGHSDNQ